MPSRKLSDDPIFYVYALVDPRNNETFYIGKGKNRRAWQHVSQARHYSGRNHKKAERIREIVGLGLEVIVVKLAENLPEAKAYGLEAKLIREQKERLTNGQTSSLEGLHLDHINAATWCNRFRWDPVDWLMTYYRKFRRSPDQFEMETYKRMRVVLLTSLLRAKEELQRYEPSEKQAKAEG